MDMISIVIPVYNSEGCLEKLYNEIEKALTGFQYELILVNDQSRDHSWEIIKQLALTHSHVRGINLRKNAGQDNALMAGLSKVTGSYVVIMDDDLQHDPRDIPALYREIEKGYDVCFAYFADIKQSWWKNFGSWLNGKLADITMGKPKHVYLSPYKIIKRDVVDEMLNYRGPFPYIDGLIFQITNHVCQIRADHQERYAGRSNYNLWRSLKVLIKSVTGFSVVPLRFASLSGMFSAVAGVMLALYYLFEHFLEDKTVEGWTTLVVLMMFVNGMILMCLGMIGEYLGRVYLSINKKPQYIIKEIVNAEASPDSP